MKSSLLPKSQISIAPRGVLVLIMVIIIKSEEKEKLTNTPTFLVEIKSCKNESWQGRLTWVEKNQTASFRSALELMKIMDSAVANDEED